MKKLHNKKRFVRKVLLGGFFLLILSSVWSAVVLKNLSCQKTSGQSDNSQCIYRVTGQIFNKPNVASNLYAMSNMPYALCSSAACLINSADVATCVCKVYGIDSNEPAWKKASVGPYDFKKAQPNNKNGNLTEVTSNYSLANVVGQNKSAVSSKACVYPKPTAWANCFGVRCTVNKKQSNSEITATCHCPVMKTAQFVSAGPADPSKCDLPSNKVWSAASLQQGQNDLVIMQNIYKRFYPNSPFAN